MNDCTVTKWKSAIDRGLGNLSTKVKKSMQVPSKMSYALKLYDHGISLATAAHQAGVSEDDFVVELKKRRGK
jgi:predicted HTH domain antitoxin